MRGMGCRFFIIFVVMFLFLIVSCSGVVLALDYFECTASSVYIATDGPHSSHKLYFMDADTLSGSWALIYDGCSHSGCFPIADTYFENTYAPANTNESQYVLYANDSTWVSSSTFTYDGGKYQRDISFCELKHCDDQMLYEDLDGDGFGNYTSSIFTCAQEGYVNNSLDCDDFVASCATDCDSFSYLDSDSDGYGTGVGVRSCDISEGYSADNANDCDDSLPQVNPGLVEEGSLCTDTYDNDCNDLTDFEEAVCRAECSSGYAEIFRFTSLNISTSLAFNAGNFSAVYPFCINEGNGQSGFQKECDPYYSQVLKYNPSNGLVLLPSVADSSYNESVCLATTSCVVSNECQNGFTKMLALETETGGHVSNPDVNSNYYLCCNQLKTGVSFEQRSGSSRELLCSSVSDGFCPEEFEDSTGQKISCSKFDDPDCGYGFGVSSSVSLLFPDKLYVISATNSKGARVQVVDEQDLLSVYSLTFKVSLNSSISSSKTSIQFSTSEVSPTVLFDGDLLSVCDVAVNVSPCYNWLENSRVLDVYHSLSTHTIETRFSYGRFSLFLVIMILFAILLPIIVIQYSRTKGKSSFLHTLFSKSSDSSHSARSSFEGEVSQDVLKIHKYVEDRLKEGDSEKEIRNNLLQAHWEPHAVEFAMSSLHKTVGDKKKLQDYINACVIMGVPRSKVYAMLISAGWNKEDIDDAYRKA